MGHALLFLGHRGVAESTVIPMRRPNARFFCLTPLIRHPREQYFWMSFSGRFRVVNTCSHQLHSRSVRTGLPEVRGFGSGIVPKMRSTGVVPHRHDCVVIPLNSSLPKVMAQWQTVQVIGAVP